MLSLVGIGCRPEVTCAEGGAACGGDPSGTWTVVDACRDPVFARPMEVTYQGQPVEMARVPSPVMASSDWCSSVLLGTSNPPTLALPHDTLAVQGGQLSYESDDPARPDQGTYTATIATVGPGSIDLSRSCIARGGALLSCAEVTAALADLATVRPSKPGVPCSDSPDQPARCQYYVSYTDIACSDIAGGGCHCAYTVSFAGAFSGRWTAVGGRLSHADASKTLPTEADYCVSDGGAAMALWGADRTSILDQAGLRTLKLQRVIP